MLHQVVLNIQVHKVADDEMQGMRFWSFSSQILHQVVLIAQVHDVVDNEVQM